MPAHPRRFKCVPSQGSDGERCRIRKRIEVEVSLLRTEREAIWTDFPVGGMRCRVRQNLVRTLHTTARQIVIRAASIRNRNRRARLVRLDPGAVPSTEHPVLETATIHEPAALSERKLPRKCTHKPMLNVVAG